MRPRHLPALLRLAWESVRRQPVASGLTMLAVALGVTLVVVVTTLKQSTDRSYREAARGYDAILAPPHGSPLQAVLSTLFHVDQPGGTLSWSVYEEAQKDPRVKVAIPYAMGDTFRGHRVIGTTDAMFQALQGLDGRPLGEDIEGRMFRAGRFEAIVGSAVARQANIGLGFGMQVTHGLEEGGHQHGEVWRIVGVLRPTGTPHDRAVYIPIDTFFAIPGHDAKAPKNPFALEDYEKEDGADDDAEDQREKSLSAVGVRLVAPAMRLAYLQEFRTTRVDAQAVLPSDQIRKLLAIVGKVDGAFRIVAWLVAVQASLMILVGLYNSIHGRRREIAVLRALGAGRRHVFLTLLLEASLLCVGGGLLGLLIGHGAAAAAAPTLLETWGIRLDPGFGLMDVRILGVLLGLGLLAGLLPAWRGIRTPVAESLHPDV